MRIRVDRDIESADGHSLVLQFGFQQAQIGLDNGLDRRLVRLDAHHQLALVTRDGQLYPAEKVGLEADMNRRAALNRPHGCLVDDLSHHRGMKPFGGRCITGWEHTRLAAGVTRGARDRRLSRRGFGGVIYGQRWL